VNFRSKVADFLVRHKSVIDTMSKLQESSAKVNRSVCKAVTFCGCLSIKAQKQDYPTDATLKDCKEFMDTHLTGELCENCREIIEEKMGDNLFYLAALCSLLEMNMEELFGKELERLNTLGYFVSSDSAGTLKYASP
jgi:RecJ-like exonuclease